MATRVRSYWHKILLTAFLSALCEYAFAQSKGYTGPYPIGGPEKLVLQLYAIDFTPAQRRMLARETIVLDFEITTEGNAILEKIHGILDGAIIDSIFFVSRKLPGFSPATRDGIPEPSVYVVHLKYRSVDEYGEPVTDYTNHTRPLTRDDFEIIETGQRIDITISGLFNFYDGNASTYLYPGGGIKLDALFTRRSIIFGGIALAVYGNRLQRDYPVSIPFQQNSGQTTVHVGLAIARKIRAVGRSELFVQFEPSYVAQTVVSFGEDSDERPIQFRGFSPGIGIHYAIRLGKEHFNPIQPFIHVNRINFHTSIRPLWLNERSASGIMMEAGIGWRIQTDHISEYKLK